MADVFGDLDLFSEFDKDREAAGSFIHYEEETNRSRIIFEGSESETEDDSDEETVLLGSKEAGGLGQSCESGNKQTDSAESTEKSNENGEKEKEESEQFNIKIELEEGVNNNGDGHPVVASNSKSDLSHNMMDENKKKTAWLNEQLHMDAAEEAKKSNTSAQQLIYERNKFRRFAKVLDSTRYTPDEESPAVQLLFNNNSFARKYRQQIEQFIKGLLWEEFRTPKETMSEVTVKPGHVSCVDINKDLKLEQRSERMRQKHALIGNSQFHKQFLIDFLGWPFNVAEPARCNINWEIPLYGQIFNEVYTQTSIKNETKKEVKSKPACWNCGDVAHAVMDCKQPRNPSRIAASRQQFMAQQKKPSGPKFTGASRYHLDPEIASKYTKFQPGTISHTLQQALGLSSDQLPQHIYKMRLYGYPPGWLAEAKKKQSGVSIFDKHGREALITGECLEDGEVAEKKAEQEQPDYDFNKIIEYAGFTVPVPIGFKDEHVAFKMPSIQEHQLKKTLMPQKETKKRKRTKSENVTEETKKLKTESAGGEAEEGEIADENSVTIEEDGDTQKIVEEEVKTPQLEKASSTKSVSMDFGTPILTRVKSSLPDAALFAKDAEEHIPFENLPNSTGTFEKMRELIEQIRNKGKQ